MHNPDFHTPSANGSLVYLNCQPDLQLVLDRVEAVGGKILIRKTLISPEQNLGYFAVINDSEGNRVALHSMG